MEGKWRPASVLNVLAALSSAFLALWFVSVSYAFFLVIRGTPLYFSIPLTGSTHEVHLQRDILGDYWTLSVRPALVLSTLVFFAQVFLWNLLKVYHAYTSYYAMDGITEEEIASCVSRLEALHSTKVHVRDTDFEAAVEELSERLSKGDHDFLNSPFAAGPKVARESAVFLGSGRAAMLQNAHPFIATGVYQHSSMMETGAQKRFYDTFNYVFAMVYSTKRTILRAAKAVRLIHNNVHGSFPESVGIYSKGDTYTAHNPHVMLWVAATLTDTTILMHELFVHRLGEDQKSEAVRGNTRFNMLFGIPEDLQPRSWREFKIYNHAMWRSQVLRVGSHGKSIYSFLFKAPRRSHAPVMWWSEVTTRALLPPSVRCQFGNDLTVVEWLMFFSSFAILRFVYSLLPPSFRFLTAHLKQEEALGVVRRPAFLGKVSQFLAKASLDLILPPKKKRRSRKGSTSPAHATKQA